MKTVFIVILNFNNASVTKDCLKSLVFCDEVVIIDSGSKDKTIDCTALLNAPNIDINIENNKGTTPLQAVTNFAMNVIYLHHKKNDKKSRLITLSEEDMEKKPKDNFALISYDIYDKHVLNRKSLTSLLDNIFKLIILLIENGANPCRVNPDGNTDLAVIYRAVDLINQYNPDFATNIKCSVSNAILNYNKKEHMKRNAYLNLLIVLN